MEIRSRVCVSGEIAGLREAQRSAVVGSIRVTMGSPLPLFRPAAVAARRRAALGTIVLTRPLPSTVLAAFFAALAGTVAAFGGLASYTAHSTLRGRVAPERGVVEIASPQAGTIVERHVVEAQRVAAGEPLFVVSSERRTSDGTALQHAVGAELTRRRDSLVLEIANTRQLEREERSALTQRRAALAAEAAAIDGALAAQRRRVALAADARERYAKMRAEGFVSEEQWTLRAAEVLDQQSRLEALERDAAALARLVAEVEERAATLDLRYANAVGALERAVGAADREIVENEARRAVVIAAPQAGVVTGVVTALGQPTEPGAVLARLVPEEARLIAELFAPSRAVGFVAAGDEVRLRYAAFPYQKFGHARGTVTSISATTVVAGTAQDEPLYRVAVALESEVVLAYGVPRRLLPGMRVEADVLLERRRLYEWVLEPLFALTGRTR
jgi:membrane fusion protein